MAEFSNGYRWGSHYWVWLYFTGSPLWLWARLRETSVIFVFHLLYSSHTTSGIDIILPSWKSSYNSPLEGLELPLRGWGEWWFYHVWGEEVEFCNLALFLNPPVLVSYLWSGNTNTCSSCECLFISSSTQSIILISLLCLLLEPNLGLLVCVQ